jgi:hypothetical protein
VVQAKEQDDNNNNDNGDNHFEEKDSIMISCSRDDMLIDGKLTYTIQRKANPEMVNLIYNILTANDRRHGDHDDNDNAIKYLEANKDSILDLAERNYENLVEALANNAINTAADGSSNPLFFIRIASNKNCIKAAVLDFIHVWDSYTR